MSMTPNHQPLSGVTVLDLTQFESGTVCTETLAWLGAEVWKVERPGKGELGRYSVAEPGIDSYGFLIVNMNKKSITCNMKTPEGLELILGLVPKADVIVENMGPGSIERLGLGYEACKALNETIVFASIKGFSPDSPYAEYPAFDPIATHTGGFVAATGFPDQPVKAGVSVADSGTGMCCAMAIIAALYQVKTQGVGQRIDISMQDYIIGLGRAGWEMFYKTGQPPRRVGNGMPLENVAPSGTYRCKPGGPNDYVHIYCSRASNDQFHRLCLVIGHEELIDDPRMATPQSRYQYRDELDEYITEWTMQHTKKEAMDIVAGADVPAGALLDISDFASDPAYMEQGIIVEVDHPQRGRIKMPGFAPRMSENRIEYRRSPGLGENNEEIYGGILGLSGERMRELKEKKVI
ncbi:MAG: CoA transferase [Oscillospiraceae bacterium]|nr:CoA transferase [Oscillospiraceae bacterium]